MRLGGAGNSSEPSWDMSWADWVGPAAAVGIRCGLYRAGSPAGMLLEAMLMGRDQYSLPEEVLMYSNRMRRLADVSCLSGVNAKPAHSE